MAATSPPDPQLGSDVPGWRWDEKRDFRVSSAYQFLMDMLVRSRDIKWRKIWALKVPHRVRVFMWLAAHQAHLTNVERVRRHLATSDECVLCHGGPEDMDHVMRSCAFARDFWGSVLSPARCSKLLDVDYVEWESILDKGSHLIAECAMAFGSPQHHTTNAPSSASKWEGPDRGWKR
ncbi:hypothetical protein V6N13_049084 [Hibiscus sabdariffa]